MSSTKIVCTIGPASSERKTLKALVRAGMDVCRLNFSHGEFSEHKKVIQNVRSISRELRKPIAIIGDLQGPKIRVGDLPKAGISLRQNERIILVMNDKFYARKNSCKEIPVQYKNLYKDVKKRDRIFLDDGKMELYVTGVRGKRVLCRVIFGGRLKSHKGLNVPTASLKIPGITEKDKKDLAFALKNKVDYVALSFVRTKDDILKLRKMMGRAGKGLNSTKIISKIEKREAIRNFDEILESSDGVMVARGDLAIEAGPERIALYQKMIILKTLESAKPVITATQMMASMEEEPFPTRAEISDVTNAVIDHTDAVMLSGESATGKFPVKTVRMMDRIVHETEESPYDDLIPGDANIDELTPEEAVSAYAVELAGKVEAKALVVVSDSGFNARMIARFRPKLPILALIKSEIVVRQLVLSWGVIPIFERSLKSWREIFAKAKKHLLKSRIARKGDKVVFVGKEMGEGKRILSVVKVHTL